MQSPGSPKGAYTSHGVGHDWNIFSVGRRYRVVQAFVDFDRQVHPIGEEWTYIGAAFLPYDDGRSIFVSLDGDREWHIRMQDREEEQQGVLDHIGEYVVEIRT
jgi:hypothetical protein